MEGRVSRIEGGQFSKWGSRLSASKFARVSPIESGSFSKRGPRLSAVHIRFKSLQELHGLVAGNFRNVALALAPRTFVFTKLPELHGLRT
eukprot:6801730-Pyramimonas_sp.AAC.1